jgi:hypothetical protein
MVLGKRQPHNLSERGATALLVALSLLLLMGIMAIGLDGGRLYGERRRAHNAADLAALTAAWTECIGGTESAAVAAGLASAASNGFNNDGVTNTVTVNKLGNRRYRATVDTDIPAVFARVFSSNPLATGATAVGYCDRGGGGEYALFASGNNCPSVNQIQWNANNVTVIGKVHSNDEINIPANNATVDGETTHTGTFTSTGTGLNLDPPPFSSGQQAYPKTWSLTDYAPSSTATPGTIAYKANQLGQYYNHGTSGWNTGDGVLLLPGVHYVAGNVRIGQNLGVILPALPGQYEGVTIVSKNGLIDFTGNNVALSFWEHPDNNGLLLFTTKPEPPATSPSCTEAAIRLRGNNIATTGILYAPNGVIDTQGLTNAPAVGALWAYRILLSGENYSVTFPQLPVQSEPVVELYE